MSFIKEKYDLFILWLVSVLFAWFVAVVISFGMRQRMSHNKGVAAKGLLRIIDNPRFPKHSFFQPGRQFDCRIRHASVSFFDDAMTQVRSISIKFADSRFKSPLDLELNTGPISIFWTAANFLAFVWNRREKGGIQYKDYYEKYPNGKKGAQVSGKYNPVSFSKMTYYSKNPLRFIDRNGNQYYVKYRVIPDGNMVETGQIPPDRQETVYDQRVKDSSPLPVNYLIDEYEQRLKKGKISYMLQMQLHQPSPDDTDEIFNSFVDWDEDTHPWMDLARFEVDKILDYPETVKMGFSVNHYPSSLGHLPARSIHDYNSIVYMRSKTTITYLARRFAYMLFGLPKEIPDNAPRNE